MAISSDFIGQRQERLLHLQKLIELGFNPYPAHSKKKFWHNKLNSDFGALEGKEITTAGRVMSWRTHGKLIFADLQDQTGRVQICLRKDELTSTPKMSLGWEDLNLLDVGDFIQITGALGKTNAGQITVFAKELILLTKALRPLPDTLDNKEVIFRRRYLDLTLNKEHRELFTRKSKFWQKSREFLQKEGFVEVETPVLEYVTGGADARPFITHHNTLDADFYLRISTELYQKRLIGGGYEKIYTFGPNFRNEGTSDEHLQEYSQLEWYWAYADYRDNMDLTKNLFRSVALEVWGKTKFETRGHIFDLADDWTEVDYIEIIKERFNIDIFESSDEEIANVIKSQGLELEGVLNRNRMIDNLWKLIRKTISGPAFLVNEPAFMSPLAKSKPEDPRITERYHVILAGSELANGYSEINDPQDQLNRFLEQQKMREGGDDEAQMLDIDYVEMLEWGMPPTSGHGHSERVFWFFENITAREGVFFPQVKPEVDELTKKIYPQVNFEIKIKPNIKANKETEYQKPLYVIFDLDGVIANTMENSLIATKEIVTKDHTEAINDLLSYFEKPTHSRSHELTEDDVSRHTNEHKTFGEVIGRYGVKLFDGFVEELKKIPFTQIGVVTSGSENYAREAAKSAGLNFSHILCMEDHHSKEEKVEHICRDWGISPKDAYYFTDSVTDFLELKDTMNDKKIIGCAWGFQGYLKLRTVLPAEQILQDYAEVHTILSSKSKTHETSMLTKTTVTGKMISRAEAWNLVCEHIQNKGLRNHCLCVESTMKALARHFKADEELWGTIGLLHDADWEECKDSPAEHTLKLMTWLKDLSYDHSIVNKAILAHAHHVTGKPAPEDDLEWSLFCCDELTGLIVATALILPSKKLSDVSVESVLKKFNSKNFAAAIDREQIKLCESKLNITLSEFVEITLNAMRGIHEEIGL